MVLLGMVFRDGTKWASATDIFGSVGKMRLVRLHLVCLGRRVFCMKIVHLRTAAKMHLDGYNASTQFASCQACKPYKQLT